MGNRNRNFENGKIKDHSGCKESTFNVTLKMKIFELVFIDA